MALVLACRGVGPETIGSFLQPSLRNLTDPYLLPGTAAAAQRLWLAISRGEPILIHGDYDTDGITAAVLLAWCLRQNGARVECFLPHRLDDGYGLTPESVAKACQDHPFPLLVTVDCGINSYEAIRHARDRGMDVIVTDHHEPGVELPAANVVINPKLPGGPPELYDLAGVGVAFKLCHAFLKYGREQGLGGMATDLRNVLDLVALGTVADIVPLLRENRCLVRHGLQILSGQQRPGVRALCEISGLGEAESIRAADITFKLAPRINAAGRLGDPMESMRLLDSRGMNDAMPLAQGLDAKNRERQQLEEQALVAAEAQIADRIRLAERRAIAVWDAHWPQGVIGIVASRLVRHYHRPCVVLTLDAAGQWRGSVRSVRRVNIVQVLEQCQRHLIRFGGHPMAAGLSVAPERLEAFDAAFEAAVRQLLGAEGLHPSLDICGEIGLAEIDELAVNELGELEPFGHSNPEPLFLSRRVAPERILPAGRNHARGTVSDQSRGRHPFILFGKVPAELPPPPWDIVYTPRFNLYNGNRQIQLQLHDLRTAAGG
ncbi:MAG: single-stranded-DNA-specific exonuclease RecJ [Lentisphaeria bacterium]